MPSLAPEVAAAKKKTVLEALLARVETHARRAPSSRRAPSGPAPRPLEPLRPAPMQPEKISAEDPRWSAPTPAAVQPDKISAEDPRWSTPSRAPLAPSARPLETATRPVAAPPAKAGPHAAGAPMKIATPQGDRAMRLTALLARIDANRRPPGR